MIYKLRYCLIFCFCFYCLFVSSQTINELERQKKEVSTRITNANKLLVKYSDQKITNLNSIKVLNNQITDRKHLIKLYHDEISVLKEDINLLNIEIENNEKELYTLKSQYAKLISETFVNKKKYNELSFFFGAESFNTAYRRYVMLKEYNRFRHNQGILIEKKSTQLNNSSLLLKSKLKVQSNTLKRIEDETNKLKSDKANLDKNIDDLNQKQDELTKELKRHKKALKKLENAIVKMVEELSNTKVEPSDFHLSKGSLPWPVSKGVVIGKFGQHQHPVLKYVKVDNNGIDIQSSSSSEAKAVFSGIVTRVVSIPGYNKAVLIRHGKYLTVYANLGVVNVNKGQNVTNQTVIGTIYSGAGDNSGVLHFEIWEESVKLNPEVWLRK